MTEPNRILLLCTEVVLDGLECAVDDLVSYINNENARKKAKEQKKKMPRKLPVKGDLYWVMSDSKDKFTFVWYCNLLKVNYKAIREGYIKLVKDSIRNGTPIKFRK